MQEGLIDVWRALRNGSAPSAFFIEKRMARWCRWLGRRLPADYEDMLSFDALEGTRHEPVAE